LIKQKDEKKQQKPWSKLSEEENDIWKKVQSKIKNQKWKKLWEIDDLTKIEEQRILKTFKKLGIAQNEDETLD